MPKYYTSRIDKRCQHFFASELDRGILRQGWGSSPEHDLRNDDLPKDVAKNRSYFQVKKGDRLLVPDVPRWGEVSIVEATQDFATGYKFEVADVDGKFRDYGHQFPVRILNSFNRHNVHVHAELRKTLRTPMRFWSIDPYGEHVEYLIAIDKDKLHDSSTYSERYADAIRQEAEAGVQEIGKRVFAKAIEHFQAAEWEFALVEALQQLYPQYVVTRSGGVAEAEHGCDIMVYLPAPHPKQQDGYVIGIQVKDYSGTVSSEVLDQINKAQDYFNKPEHTEELIDLWIFAMRSNRADNAELQKAAKLDKVRVFYQVDMEDLFGRAGMVSVER